MGCFKINYMKKILSLFLLLSLTVTQVFALDDNSLPALPNLPDFDRVLPPDNMDVFSPSATPPKIAPAVSPIQKPIAKTPPPVQKQVSAPAKKPAAVSQKPVNNSKNSYYKNNIKTSYILPKGKKFKVRLDNNISDKSPEGSIITFKSIYPETARYITVPAGTVFKGKITDTHPPYITGNGGLIVINVDRMVYHGNTYEIDAKVSVAAGKHIFLNNIKGKRMYFQSIPKSMKPGTTFFKKMWKVTCNLAKNENGVEIILTPFSLITGTLVYAVNFVASPVLAIFYKGKSITIPRDSQFTIQLREDAVLLK